MCRWSSWTIYICNFTMKHFGNKLQTKHAFFVTVTLNSWDKINGAVHWHITEKIYQYLFLIKIIDKQRGIWKKVWKFIFVVTVLWIFSIELYPLTRYTAYIRFFWKPSFYVNTLFRTICYNWNRRETRSHSETWYKILWIV